MALSKEEMIFKQMTDNIDQPFPIVIDKSYSLSFDSYARGCHVYINIWNSVDGEILVCTRKIDNPHDDYAVSIVRNSCVVRKKAINNILLQVDNLVGKFKS